MYAHGGSPLLVMLTRCGVPPWTSTFSAADAAPMLHARTHCLCPNNQLYYPCRKRLTAARLHARANAG
eukprot:1185500-Lingulodinium_polyedra.AAC.1